MAIDPQPLGALLQARYIGTLHGQTTINTFHYVTALSLTAIYAFYSALEGVLTQPYLTCLSSDYTLIRIDINSIQPPPRSFTLTMNRSSPGLGPTPSCPSSVAAVISKNTDLAGRKYRGRVYIPAVPAAWEVNSEITPFGMADFNSLATAMAAPLMFQGSTGWLPVVPTKAPGPTLGWEPQPIRQCVARPILRNQRRRQIGVGI